jgi:SAM-dependent methyltransferase
MGRFASTVALYQRFRPPYPPQFFRAVAEKLGLTTQSSLIDLGTGPGLLALGFAPYVGRIVGVDPEPNMLAAARESAARAGRPFTLIAGKAEELPEDVGAFDLVTIGRALHWMDHDALKPLFARLVAPGGAIAICASTSARDGRNEWLDAYNDVRRAWADATLWSESGEGRRARRDVNLALGPAGFAVADVVRVESTHEVSVQDLAQRTLTFSATSPAALGEKADAMVADVETHLAPFARGGAVTEVVVSIAEVARRTTSA